MVMINYPPPNIQAFHYEVFIFQEIKIDKGAGTAPLLE
jgi:hypothetical protein